MMKFVATKTAGQLDLQALHRVREGLVRRRAGIINQIRASLLERGIAVRQGSALCAPNCRASTRHHSDIFRPHHGSRRNQLYLVLGF
jgi:transposase